MPGLGREEEGRKKESERGERKVKRQKSSGEREKEKNLPIRSPGGFAGEEKKAHRLHLESIH